MVNLNEFLSIVLVLGSILVVVFYMLGYLILLDSYEYMI